MRILADCLLAAWCVLNLVLAAAARRAPLVAATFAAAGLLSGAGLAAGNFPVLVAGLVASLAAPVLYGQRITGHNYLTHHLVRAVVVAGLAVLYGLS